MGRERIDLLQNRSQLRIHLFLHPNPNTVENELHLGSDEIRTKHVVLEGREVGGEEGEVLQVKPSRVKPMIQS